MGEEERLLRRPRCPSRFPPRRGPSAASRSPRTASISKTWKLASLPYLVWAPVGKVPAERELIRALKSLAKKADEIVIATDFDREGGADRI